MMTEKKTKTDLLCIIPARGGSKRLPGKNIKNFLGKPLIAWTIETAIRSEVFDSVIVMTDSEDIAKIASRHGSSSVFKLPPELASDTAYVGDAIKYMLGTLEGQGESWTDFILLEPTAPGRQPDHIQEVASMLKERSDADSIVGVTEISPNQGVHKALSIDEKQFVGRASDGAPLKDMKHRTQDILPTFYINSSIYAARRSNFDKGGLWGDSTLGFIMDPRYSFDIDTQEDWDLAEFKMGKLLEEKVSK